MDFQSSTGRVPRQHGACFFGRTGRILPLASSKSEVDNSDCFVIFSNWKNELCDSDLSKLIEEL